jgi:hypothetical protein
MEDDDGDGEKQVGRNSTYTYAIYTYLYSCNLQSGIEDYHIQRSGNGRRRSCCVRGHLHQQRSAAHHSSKITLPHFFMPECTTTRVACGQHSWVERLGLHQVQCKKEAGVSSGTIRGGTPRTACGQLQAWQGRRRAAEVDDEWLPENWRLVILGAR